ncbi:MAG: hypothetical protein BLM47_11660 [Candidatus Reconcilbacillus cellulovorans]|uniref:Integrase catalytic domain-containing protein n=1 Tax=Candidatus Reconcilbacillus cellulovorans TaxID=1906605 RepID=A0A2A6DXL7_9BACL|nr:MAG: hypothetical protein BLM47_11660 [Candidatus Reconcilbacillus cellulovorans]
MFEKAYQRPKGEGLHHSDRGSQYASHEYQKRLLEYGMKSSMSRKCNCIVTTMLSWNHFKESRKRS